MALIEERLSNAPQAVRLADLGNDLHAEMHDAIEQTNWFATGSLTAAIRRAFDDKYSIEAGHVWDPQRNASPSSDSLGPVRLSVPPAVERMCSVIELPRLDSDTWKAVFEVLAEYAREHEFNLTECTSLCRDRLLERGYRVGRQSVGFVVRGAMYGGVPLNMTPAPSSASIKAAFFRSQLQRANVMRLELSAEELNDVRAWIVPDLEGGEVPDPEDS